MSKKFHYKNTERITNHDGTRVVRNVTIKNGRGHKSVTHYHRGKKVGTVKKALNGVQMELIKIKKFIPGLFSDCKCREKKR